MTTTDIAPDLAGEEPLGLWLEIEKDLIEPKLMLGIDRRLAAMLVGFVLVIALVTHIYWFILAIVPAHLVIWFGTKSDVDMVNIYLRYAKQGNGYESIQKLPQKRNLRPDGFARGMLC